MKSKFVSFFSRYNWKAFIIILSFLIGGILSLPALRIFPILTNIIFVKLSHNVSSLDTDNDPNPISHYENQTNSIYLPLISLPNVEIEKQQTENNQNSRLSTIDISQTGTQITIQLHHKESKPNRKSMAEISFLPGEQCIFGDGRACVYNFADTNNNKIILASVHSGIGGEGESFRDLIEGTGINHGLYTTEQVKNNIRSLIGSEMHINQGETTLTGLVLHDIVRIPSVYIETYLSLPVEHTLAFVEEITGANWADFNQELFILETCGWRLPDEKHSSDYPNTMQSIYLGLFSFHN